MFQVAQLILIKILIAKTVAVVSQIFVFPQQNVFLRRYSDNIYFYFTLLNSVKKILYKL